MSEKKTQLCRSFVRLTTEVFEPQNHCTTRYCVFYRLIDGPEALKRTLSTKMCGCLGKKSKEREHKADAAGLPEACAAASRDLSGVLF